MKKKRREIKTKKKRSIAGSLAMRVFATGFIFLVVPLILYTLFIYKKEYKDQTFAFYKGISVIQDDVNHYFNIIHASDLANIELIHSFVDYVKSSHEISDKAVQKILKTSVNMRDVDAFFYCQIKGSRGLICTSATDDEYLGFNFSNVFSSVLKEKQQGMILAKDPVFGYAIFVFKAFKKKGSEELEGVVVEVVELKGLVNLLAKYQHIFKVDVSILDTKYDVLASSEALLENKKFVVSEEKEENEDDFDQDTSLVQLYKSPIYKGGFHFYKQNNKRLALFSNIKDLNGYLLISIPEILVLKKVINQILFLAFFLFFIVVVGSLLSILVAARMARPLKKLTYIFQGVGQGDLNQKYKEDRFGFEINYLGLSFNDMLNRLKVHIKEVQEEKAKKEAYMRELEIGKEIQYSIFPQENMVIEGIDSSFYFLGAQEVAGDFYDWKTMGQKTIITIADGVGKGVLGCLYSLDLRSILRSMAYKSEDLLQIVTSTNQLFCTDTKDSGNFVTAFIAEYDHKTHVVRYVNCGHNPPMYLMQNGQVQELHTHGMAFGVDESVTFEQKEIELKKGEFILFFTDGINETMNEKGELFTTQRLIEDLKALKHLPAAKILEDLNETLVAFQGAASQHDDKTMILFKYQG